MNKQQPPRYGQYRSDEESSQSTCPRHRNKAAEIRCNRCRRLVCDECAVDAPVGFQCTDCVNESALANTRVNPLVSIGRSSQAGFTPFVTYTMMALCGVLMVVEFLFPLANVYLGFIPVVALREPWRFLTTAFMHADLVHIGLNMFALLQIGPSIERVLGHVRFFALYILSALGASVSVLVYAFFIDHNALFTNTVGASGAVFGTFAAVFMIQRHFGLNTASILVLLGVNLVWGFMIPSVSWQGHLGGLITGGLVSAGFLAVVRRVKRIREQAFMTGGTAALNESPTERFGTVLVIVVTLLVLALLVIGVAVTFDMPWFR